MLHLQAPTMLMVVYAPQSHFPSLWSTSLLFAFSVRWWSVGGCGRTGSSLCCLTTAYIASQLEPIAQPWAWRFKTVQSCHGNRCSHQEESDKYEAPTRATPQIFPDLCTGHKQLKPVCIPPLRPYPTPRHPTSTPQCHECRGMVVPNSSSLPGAKMPLGSLFQGDKGPEAEICSVLTAFKAATAFHPSWPHRRRGLCCVSCASTQGPEQAMEQKMP